MRQVLLFTLLFICLQSFSQTVEFNLNMYDKEHEFQLYLVKENGDTVFTKTIQKTYAEELTGLTPGIYFFHVYCHELQAEKLIFKRYVLETGKNLKISYNLDKNVDKNGTIEEERPETNLGELQFYLGSHPNSMTKENPAFQNNFILRGEFNMTKLRRHAAFVYTYGYEYKRHGINGDTSFFQQGAANFSKEYLHQITLNLGLKARVFSGKVTTQVNKPKLFLDLGFSYHLPLMNRHVGIMKTGPKIMEQHISTFTDFRISAVSGFYPFSLFVYYRPFKVVQSPLPQPSQFEFGISWIFGIN